MKKKSKQKTAFRMDAPIEWPAVKKLFAPTPEASAARERMLQRRRRDSEELPGGPKQSAPSAETAGASMIECGKQTSERYRPETVEELLQLYKNGRLKPDEAYAFFLDIGDERLMTVKQAKLYFLGREDAAGARERMLRRMGLSR